MATHFEVPLGAVVDAAVADLFAQVMARVDVEGTRAGSLPSAGALSEIKTLDAWMQMREGDRLSPDDRSAADGLATLEADLAVRRAKLKDDLTKLE